MFCWLVYVKVRKLGRCCRKINSASDLPLCCCFWVFTYFGVVRTDPNRDEILFLPAEKSCVKLRSVRPTSPSLLFSYFCSGTWIYTHILQCCTLSFCCVSAHCCTEGRRVGNFSTCAEINFGRPPLSLSLSVCLEREDDKSFNWTFPFVCGGTGSVQQT